MNVNLPRLLTERLAGPLPDAWAMSRFTPDWGNAVPPVAPNDAREAAVLVLLYPHEDQWWVPLTRRAQHMAEHAGQISLPGGSLEPGETPAEAAVREFHEELGGDIELDLLGHLSARYVASSRYRVEPWVAVAARRGRLAPNPLEVAELLEVPLARLINPALWGRHERPWPTSAAPTCMDDSGNVVRGMLPTPVSWPHFQWYEDRIWGATCTILGELVLVLDGLEL